MSRHYIENGIKHPSVTTVLGEADSGPPLYWSANMVVKWIEEECEWHSHHPDGERFEHYIVTDDELNDARTYYDRYSKAAMKTGSDMHSFAERFLNDRIRTGD